MMLCRTPRSTLCDAVCGTSFPIPLTAIATMPLSGALVPESRIQVEEEESLTGSTAACSPSQQAGAVGAAKCARRWSWQFWRLSPTFSSRLRLEVCGSALRNCKGSGYGVVGGARDNSPRCRCRYRCR